MIISILALWSLIQRYDLLICLTLGIIFIESFCYLFASYNLVSKFFALSIFLLCFRLPSKTNLEDCVVFSSSLALLSISQFSGLVAFYPLGERFRDFGLLAEAYFLTSKFQEPWLAGVDVNYYVKLYRFWGLAGKDLGLSVEQLYYFSLAGTFALAFAFLFKFFRLLKLQLAHSWAASTFTLLAPNVASVFEALSNFNNFRFWEVSRVLEGTINEFPVWSFLFGDLHPHVMATALVSALLYSFKRFESFFRSNFLCFSLFSMFGGFLILVSNPWDVFIWAFACVFTALAFFSKKDLVSVFNDPRFFLESLLKHLEARGLVVLGIIFTANLVDFYWTISQAYPIKVLALKYQSDFLKFLEHFGFLFALIFVGLSKSRWRGLLFLMCLLVGAALDKFGVFFFCLVLSLLVFRRNLTSALLSSSLFTISLTEVFFIDDPYFDPVERMNTVFKVYYGAWILGFCSACSEVFQVLDNKKALLSTLAGLFVIGTVSMFLVLWEKRYKASGSYFDPIEAQFPGSKSCWSKLKKHPRGTVLESQERPYGWDSYFCTFSGNRCFLGWENHINLLYPHKRDDIQERKEIMKKVYEFTGACSEIKSLLKTKRVNYIFVGKMELQRYSVKLEELLACFKPICWDISNNIYLLAVD